MSTYYEPEKRTTAPNTTGWGLLQEGRQWYRKDTHRLQYWDGTQVQTLPGVAGGDAYKLVPFYTVFLSGGQVSCMDEDGNVDFGPTSDQDAAIQYALDNLASGRTVPSLVQLKGEFTSIGDHLQISKQTILQGPALLKFANGVNGKNMIELKDPTDMIGVRIRDLDLDGNRTNCSGTCHGIDLEINQPNARWEAYRLVQLENLRIQHFRNNGIKTNDTSGQGGIGPIIMDKCFVHYNTDYDIFCEHLTDSLITGETACCKAYFRHMTSTRIRDLYCGGGDDGYDNLRLEDCQNSQIIDMINDYAGKNGVYIKQGSQSIGGTKLTFVGGKISNAGKAADLTYDEVLLEYAVGCSFSHVTFSFSKTNRTNYCINEKSGVSNDYNIFANNIFTGSHSGGLNKTGANSKDDNNQTYDPS